MATAVVVVALSLRFPLKSWIKGGTPGIILHMKRTLSLRTESAVYQSVMQ